MSEEFNKKQENAEAIESTTDIDTTQEIEDVSADEGDAVKAVEVADKKASQNDTPKKRILISLKTFIISAVALVLATLMLTYTVCSSIYKKKNALPYTENLQSSYSENEVIGALLQQYFYGDVDNGKLTAESLKAYMAATGDIYAAYYTQEEIDASQQEGAGKMYGIGVNVINSTIKVNDNDIAVIKIINIISDSPAEEKGLRAGDLIVYAGIGQSRQSVDYLGYDEAVRLLKGQSGTIAEFTVWRWNTQSNSYDEIEFSVERREVNTQSVFSRIYELDNKIGIVKIAEFNFSTPTEFKKSIDELKSQGCEKFVLDVRYNPGGYLQSIAAVLSYFLNDGDVYIRTEDKNGEMKEKKVGVISEYTDEYTSCNVSASEIGMYRDLNMVVLCNQYTASAAELFTATFRDYNLGKIIGVTTYGKGKMQTTYLLSPFGLEGAVKFTTHMYYSATSPGYDGVGIKPDEGCEVELSEEASTYNAYDLPDSKDNQLAEAVKHFK